MKLNGTIEKQQTGSESRGGSPYSFVLDPNLFIQLQNRIRSRSSAFTLIEILIAVTIFGIVLVAINTVFYSGLHLQRATTRVLDESAPVQQAFAIMRRDLQAMILPPTNSAFGSWFKSGAGNRSFGSSADATLEFYTTTGTLRHENPWSDLQRVSYQLTNSTEGTTLQGRDLMRVVTRNLMPTAVEESELEYVMSGVESLEYECYDGTEWRVTWDTELGDAGLPQAVRVRLLMVNTNAVNSIRRDPLELLVPIVTQSRTNATQVAGGGV